MILRKRDFAKMCGLYKKMQSVLCSSCGKVNCDDCGVITPTSKAYDAFLESVKVLPVEERRHWAQILWDTLQSDVPVWFECSWPPKRKIEPSAPGKRSRGDIVASGVEEIMELYDDPFSAFKDAFNRSKLHYFMLAHLAPDHIGVPFMKAFGDLHKFLVEDMIPDFEKSHERNKKRKLEKEKQCGECDHCLEYTAEKEGHGDLCPCSTCSDNYAPKERCMVINVDTKTGEPLGKAYELKET